MTSAQERKIKQTGCEARFDNLTRQLYATDASIYQHNFWSLGLQRGAMRYRVLTLVNHCISVSSNEDNRYPG